MTSFSRIILLTTLSVCLKRSNAAWTTADLTPKNYNPLRLPKVDDQPVTVWITLDVMSLLAVDEAEQSFKVDITYKLRWSDYRLTLPVSDIDYPLILDTSWKSRIWVPDVFFLNALQTTLLKGFSPITSIEILRNGDVSLSARLTVKLNCDMDLFTFPHDTQQCFFDSMSLSHTSRNIILEWDEFRVDNTMYFPKFKIFDYMTGNCTPPLHDSVSNKSCTRAILKMSRKLSFYVTRYYAPSFLIVITSMVGFWIPSAAWPARVTVVLTPLLSLVTIHNTLNNEINVSYVVAIHIWMFVSVFFVFAALIEYIFVVIEINSVSSKKSASSGAEDVEDRKKKRRDHPHAVNQAFKKLVERLCGPVEWSSKGSSQVPFNRIDFFARILFPFFYFLFILIFICLFVIPWLAARH